MLNALIMFTLPKWESLVQGRIMTQDLRQTSITHKAFLGD